MRKYTSPTPPVTIISKLQIRKVKDTLIPKMAYSLDGLARYYIEDKPIVMEEIGHGAFAVVKKVDY